MSANVPAQGPIQQLEREPQTTTPISEDDVRDVPVLTRLLLSLMRDVSRLRGLWRPRRLDFEGRALLADGTTQTRLEHRFDGRARYWVVEWDGAAAPNIRAHANTDLNTLVITSTSAGVATIRVEESG